MAERSRRIGRLAGIVTAAAVVASGCSANQINGVNLADCAKGPRQGNLTMQLPKGTGIRIGGDNIGPNWGMTLTSQGNGAVDVMVGTNDNKETLNVTRNPDGSLKTIDAGNGVSFDNSGDIFFDSGDKNYEVKTSAGDSGTTKLDITDTCK